MFERGAVPRQSSVAYEDLHYCHTNNDFLFTWLMLDSFNRPYLGPGYGQSNHFSNTHLHPSENKRKSDESKAFLMLVLVAAMAAALGFIALYYLFRETIHSTERFRYNEGWLQACLSYFSLIASTTVSSLLSIVFASVPVYNLALAAGVANPFGVVMTGIVCLSLIGAGVGCFISDKIQNYVIYKLNPDALDPADPHRFALTPAEAATLESRKIDPTKVKCAIVALRAQMGDDPIPRQWGFFYSSSRSETVQRHLDMVRQLRRGELSIAQVGGMRFDCRDDSLIYPQQPHVELLDDRYPPGPPPAYSANPIFQ